MNSYEALSNFEYVIIIVDTEDCRFRFNSRRAEAANVLNFLTFYTVSLNLIWFFDHYSSLCFFSVVPKIT